MPLIKVTKLGKEEEPEVINIRNKHGGYRRRGEKKRKLDNKFLEFRFNVSYSISPAIKVPKSYVDDFDKIVYNMIIDNINTDDLRDAISSDPTLATVAEEMSFTLEKKEVFLFLETYKLTKILEDATIDFTVEPEFAWRDVYAGKGSPAWRSTSYNYTGIIYPSRVRNHNIVFDEKQNKLEE